MRQEEQKKLGNLDVDVISSSIVNYNCIRLFEKTKFHKDALEAAEYLTNNELYVKGWLNLVVIKEFLSVRMEIDLNYIDLNDSIVETFGWKIGDPLIIYLEVNESRLFNSIEPGELPYMDFAGLWQRSAIKI